MRRAAAVCALASLALLTGCTQIGDQTEQLKNELLAFDIVEGGYSTSRERTLFDEPLSSIQLDVVEDADAHQLEDLVTWWRFGVDEIDARWLFGLDKSGGGDGWDTFSVAGERSVADLTELVRFWHGIGAETDSASISIYDYSESGDGSVLLKLGSQQLADVRLFLVDLREQSYDLPGRFSWSVDADVPSGLVTVAGSNALPDEALLQSLEAIAQPVDGDLGDIWFWAILSPDTLLTGSPLRLNIGVYLEPSSVEAAPAVTPQQWAELGERVLAERDVWEAILQIAQRLPRGEAAVTLDFAVHGDKVAHLDPMRCTLESWEEVYGPLTHDLWEEWSGGRDCENQR